VETSVIILTKNAGSRFKKMLERLINQSYQDFEIIVIDSGSKDKTVEIAREFGCRVYNIRPQDFHHSRTRNLGASLSRGKYLVYITQDAYPLDKKFLEKLIQPLMEDDKVAGAYGRQIAYPNAKPMEKFFYLYFYPNKRVVITPEDLKDPIEFFISHVYISDVCSAIKKDIWMKIKFDERIIMAEDKKWAIDVLKAGYTLVYEPKAAVYHSHNYDIISVFKRRFDDGVAMRQICKLSNTILISSKAISYFINEMKYLFKSHRKWIPYSLLYNFARSFGFFLGINYERIPNILRRKLSKHKDWWMRESKVKEKL